MATPVAAPERLLPEAGRAEGDEGPVGKREAREGPFSFRRVAVDHRPVLTIPPTAGIWGDGLLEVGWRIDGALVRVQPPAEATAEKVAAVEAALRSRGAFRVRIAARASAGKVVLAPREKPKGPRRTVREVVREVVAEARTEDRAALADFCDRLLDEVGA